MDKVNIQYQPQGHRLKVKVTKVVCVFRPILHVFANSSYSFDWRVLKTHKYVLSDHTQKRNAAEVLIFNFCPQGQIIDVQGQT